MRRKDREVKDLSEIIDILNRCTVCHVSFCDEYPYTVPMNFGLKHESGETILYFHGAHEGRKHELLKKNNKVGFAADNMISAFIGEPACRSVAEYESVTGYGKMEYAEGEEKLEALECIMKKYAENAEGGFRFDEKQVERVCIMKLKAEGISAKRLVL